MNRRRILCAVPTFRRNDPLRDLLDGLAAQDLAGVDATFEIVVLDGNDANDSALAVVAECRTRSPFAIHHSPVRGPGLSTVRNAALAFVARDYDFLAMIDDDEIPDATWLRELIRVHDWTGAQVVVGPVIPVLPPGAPAWLHDLRRQETPMAADGAQLREGWSCSALVQVDYVLSLGLQFDPRLNFTGGEDQLFFRNIVARGGSIAFAARAFVREAIVPSRVSVRFNVMRSFRRGNSLSVCDVKLDGRPATLGLRAAKGLGLIGLGTLTLVPLALVRRKDALVRTSCEIARGFGMLAGLFGLLYPAYGRKA